jgi:hypothetical protein
MKGSLKLEAPTEFNNWLEKAKRKFVGAVIHNSGQFAVAIMDHKNVYLFDDFFAATDFMEGHSQYRLYDQQNNLFRK